MTARPLPLETAHLIRAAYAENELSIAEIAERFGVSRGSVGYWVKGGPSEGARHLPPMPPRYPNRARKTRSSHDRRLALVRRMWRTAETQVRDIDKRLRAEGQKPDERERDMRLFATLAKTLRELTAAERGEGPNTPDGKAAKRNDDTVPRNIDELRRSLARKLEAIIAARDSSPGGGG